MERVEVMKTQIEVLDGIMKKHPKLRFALAHFGFMSYDVEQARRWLDYENTVFDLTPGGEQLLKMGKEWNEWEKFFAEYEDRIIYGTDYYAFPQDEKWEENFLRRPKFLREFFETNTEHEYVGRPFRGVKLDEDILQKIYWDNAMGWFGEPKKIDLVYMQKKAEELLQKPSKRAKFADEDLRYILKNISEKK
jgi:predicted TIM-barrel fold metal-dependent hydrolase